MIANQFTEDLFNQLAAPFTLDWEEWRVIETSENLQKAFGCPVLMGVQSRREVAERHNKMPRQDDAQESSNVEQTSDKAITLWCPHKTEQAGSVVQTTRYAPRKDNGAYSSPQVSIEEWKVGPNLLLAGLPKQKMRATIDAVPVMVDPARSMFSDMNASGKGGNGGLNLTSRN